MGRYESLSSPEVTALVARYTPVFFLYPGDPYMPCSAEWFLSHCSANVDGKQVLEHGKVTLDAAVALNGKPNVNLDLKEEHWTGQALELNPPLYARVKQIVAKQSEDHSSIEAIEITFLTFFAFNGSYPLCGLEFWRAGDHVGDIEHLTVRCSAESGELIGVYYNSHRNCEGAWVMAKDVPMIKATAAGSEEPVPRIVSFVARFGHGHYSHPGTVFRLYRFANDYCSHAGPIWSPQRVIVLRKDPQNDAIISSASRGAPKACLLRAHRFQPTSAMRDAVREPQVVVDDGFWLQYQGKWGTADAPTRQGWFDNAEHPKSLDPFRRMWLPFTA
ncbi:hypothetical protein FVE85_1931 [Porphyridium purpureum]|uniref:Uncharacterized protein n=1 Tax=Porphyridium purpureum TaxID=35688 RepID=A0A5J4YWS2_PORPP|nr:hypothetical protein FVE85_1931 [Porphyridium purpureum]|eukprot:POR4096..scf209_3